MSSEEEEETSFQESESHPDQTSSPDPSLPLKGEEEEVESTCQSSKSERAKTAVINCDESDSEYDTDESKSGSDVTASLDPNESCVNISDESDAESDDESCSDDESEEFNNSNDYGKETSDAKSSFPEVDNEGLSSEGETIAKTIKSSHESSTTTSSDKTTITTSSDQTLICGERESMSNTVPIHMDETSTGDDENVPLNTTSTDKEHLKGGNEIYTVAVGEWKEGDHVLYSHDCEFKSPREATIIRADEDSTSGLFYIIHFNQNDENQRMAFPHQLRPPNSNLDIPNIKKNERGQEFPTQHDSPMHYKDTIPSCDRDNTNGWIDNCMSEEQMEAAMIAHQKNKAKLRKQTREVERNKTLTNRERIQEAMRNLGRPVSSTSMQKKKSRSSVESDERSSDMVQRYAVFANLDSDDEMTTGEESEMTEHVRNTRYSSTPQRKASKTHNNTKQKNIISRLRLSRKNLTAVGHNKVYSEKEYRRVEGDENDENDYVNKNSRFAQHHELDIPMATEIIQVVNDKPSFQSNISSLTMDHESARGFYVQNENNTLCSSISPPGPVTQRRKNATKFHQRKSPLIILATILAVALGCVSVLILLREQDRNKKSYVDTDNPTSIDNNILSAPIILSESFIQTLFGTNLSPMEPNQVTILETILEDTAAELNIPNKNHKMSVSTRCMINYQIHEGSVIWSRNRKRHHDEDKDGVNQDVGEINVRRNVRSLSHNEEDMPSQSLTPTDISHDNHNHELSNSIKIDFTLTYSTVSADIDLNHFLSMFLETMNSKEGKETVLMALKWRLGMAVEETDDISFRDENRAALFLRTYPTSSPYTSTPYTSSSTHKMTFQPTSVPSRSPELFSSGNPSIHTSSETKSYVPSHNPGAQIPYWDSENMVYHNFNCTSTCCLGLLGVPCQFDWCHCP